MSRGLSLMMSVATTVETVASGTSLGALPTTRISSVIRTGFSCSVLAFWSSCVSWARAGERKSARPMARRAGSASLGWERKTVVMGFSFSHWKEKPFPAFPYRPEGVTV